MIFLAAILLSFSVLSEKSEVMLQALHDKVVSWGDYRIDFRVTIADQSIRGSYEVSGKRYHVETPDIEIFSDGAARWEVNRITREVTIDRVDPADRTVMLNPTKLFDFLDGNYTHRYVGAAIINGINCDRIELKDRKLAATNSSKGLSHTSSNALTGATLDVYIAKSTGLPVRVGYMIGAMSTQAAVDVIKTTPHISLNISKFTFNPSAYKDYEIIDFR